VTTIDCNTVRMPIDLPLTPELRALLSEEELQAWLLEHCLGGGVAPAWVGEQLVLRFDLGRDAAIFVRGMKLSWEHRSAHARQA
jgi:hypothetical protein